MGIFYNELQRYEEEKACHEYEAHEAHRRCEEYRKDERWKALHCRRCPNCNRPIQRIEGCEQMTCGNDGHGGNTQQGCGHTFKWNKAVKYVASGDPEPAKASSSAA